MYLSGSIYRIHGTNAPSTIGGRVSSGCIRMINEDVVDLYSRVHVGTKVVVLPMHERRAGNTAGRIYLNNCNARDPRAGPAPSAGPAFLWRVAAPHP